MSDFNDDNAKIDAALKANADAISAEATARTAAVSAKADTSALNAETSARQAADDALAEKAGAQLIQRVTVPAATDQWYDLDLSDLDWSQWYSVALRVKPVLTAGDTYYVICNYEFPLYLGTGLSDEFFLCMFPCYSGEAPARGFFWPDSDGSNIFRPGYACGEASSFEFGTTHAPFQPGTVIELWGTR